MKLDAYDGLVIDFDPVMSTFLAQKVVAPRARQRRLNVAAFHLRCCPTSDTGGNSDAAVLAEAASGRHVLRRLPVTERCCAGRD